MLHEELQNARRFEMSENVHVKACGRVWLLTHCIRLGGSFSAQSADLHSYWALYIGRHLLHCPGT